MTSTQNKKTLVFIEKAKAKHKNKYDYSLVEYVKETKKSASFALDMEYLIKPQVVI